MEERIWLKNKDLNLIYLTSVGTWKQGVEGKKKNIEESHLFPTDKYYLKKLWDIVVCGKTFLLFLIVVNLAAFVLYGIDKSSFIEEGIILGKKWRKR